MRIQLAGTIHPINALVSGRIPAQAECIIAELGAIFVLVGKTLELLHAEDSLVTFTNQLGRESVLGRVHIKDESGLDIIKGTGVDARRLENTIFPLQSVENSDGVVGSSKPITASVKVRFNEISAVWLFKQGSAY